MEGGASFESGSNVESSFNQGVHHLETGNYSAALAAFDKVIELNAWDYRPWINRGNALANLGRTEEAIASYDRAIALKPDFSIVWMNRGDVLFDSELYQEALSSWDRALELEPDSGETWYKRGLALGRGLGFWPEALASFEMALQLNLDDAETWFNHGLSLGALDRWEEAIASWDKTLERQPDYAEAWVNKGVGYQKLGRYALAIEANDIATALQLGISASMTDSSEPLPSEADVALAPQPESQGVSPDADFEAEEVAEEEEMEQESVSPDAGLETQSSQLLQDTDQLEPAIATSAEQAIEGVAPESRLLEGTLEQALEIPMAAEPTTARVPNSDGVGAQEVLQQQDNLEQALEIPSTPAQQPDPVSHVGSFDAGGVAPDTGAQQPVGEGETNRTTATDTEEEPQQAPAAVERVGEVAPSACTQEQARTGAENSTSGE
jgi:tetratricopeptide (TPR) repeat protein